MMEGSATLGLRIAANIAKLADMTTVFGDGLRVLSASSRGNQIDLHLTEFQLPAAEIAPIPSSRTGIELCTKAAQDMTKRVLLDSKLGL